MSNSIIFTYFVHVAIFLEHILCASLSCGASKCNDEIPVELLTDINNYLKSGGSTISFLKIYI